MNAKNQKYLWWGLGIAAVVGLVVIIEKQRSKETTSGASGIASTGAVSHPTSKPTGICPGGGAWEWNSNRHEWCCVWYTPAGKQMWCPSGYFCAPNDPIAPPCQ
jgi:hypothetical protein